MIWGCRGLMRVESVLMCIGGGLACWLLPFTVRPDSFCHLRWRGVFKCPLYIRYVDGWPRVRHFKQCQPRDNNWCSETWKRRKVCQMSTLAKTLQHLTWRKRLSQSTKFCYYCCIMGKNDVIKWQTWTLSYVRIGCSQWESAISFWNQWWESSLVSQRSYGKDCV